MKASTLLPVFLVASLLAACDTIEEGPVDDLAVIEAFLYAGEPIDDIRVTATLPFGSPDTVAPPINDALIRLFKNGQGYALTPQGTDGTYHYAGTDLTVEAGDAFRLEMDYGGVTATAETVVPAPPLDVQADAETLEAPTIGIGGGPPGGGPGGGFMNTPLTITWSNPDDVYHYVVIEGLEEDAEFILPDFIRTRIGRFRIVTEPSRDDFYEIRLILLEQLGSHEARIYRVNPEYALLYENQVQDSRDLNEPPDNVDGALGIFTAFNSTRVPFDVVRAE